MGNRKFADPPQQVQMRCKQVFDRLNRAVSIRNDPNAPVHTDPVTASPYDKFLDGRVNVSLRHQSAPRVRMASTI